MELTSIMADLRLRLVAANLPENLQLAVLDLYDSSATLLPLLHNKMDWRIKYLLDHLVEEITDPTTPVHWWELALDQTITAARGLGETGVITEQYAQRLRNLLRDFMGVYAPVTLEEITMDTVKGICWLSDTLREPQSLMVAPNVYSLAQAHFNQHAWFRAISAGKAPVGFLMIIDDSQTPEYFLWRFMIAEPFQGRGYGRKAVERLIDYVRSRPGAKELGVSCGLGAGSPEGFYHKLGFTNTGEMVGDEIVLKLSLV